IIIRGFIRQCNAGYEIFRETEKLRKVEVWQFRRGSLLVRWPQACNTRGQKLSMQLKGVEFTPILNVSSTHTWYV
ncbi:MAG: hypothetical protein ACFE7I_09810, partial [Candidatus Hodarchaeota archaeon]